MHPLLRVRLSGLLVACALGLAGSAASAQEQAPAAVLTAAMPSGVFFRGGFTVGSFDMQRLTFRPSRGSRAAALSGKEFLQNGVLAGGTFGLQIDSRWFYVRVAADLYQNPDVLRPGEASARFTTVGWVGFGPRVVVGPVAFLGGVRLGALLMNVAQNDTATSSRRDFDAVEGIYAVDLGAQWRPFRWFEVDAAVSQDFGVLTGTTVSLTANFGWSRSVR